MVTVYHMLECSNMDLLQFPSYPPPLRRSNSSKNTRLDSLQSEDDAGWCLFSVEVRNTYGSPFDVTLVRTQDGETMASSTTTIPPGSASRWNLSPVPSFLLRVTHSLLCRLVIPIKKIFLSEDVLLKPIPTLSDRQFVVAQSNLSQSELKTQRELFWYREELFKCVQGLWREVMAYFVLWSFPSWILNYRLVEQDPGSCPSGLNEWLYLCSRSSDWKLLEYRCR